MTTQDQKRKFAELTLKGTSALEAAEIALDGDTGEALRVAQEWDESEEIQQLRKDIELEMGTDALLPSRDKVALELLKHARAEAAHDDKTAAYKLYCDVQGYIKKNNTSLNIKGDVDKVDVNVDGITSCEEAAKVYKEMTGG